MRFICLLLFFVLPSLFTNAQIVNVESKRLKSDTTGWLGSIGVSFEMEKSAVRVMNINTEAQLEYKAPRSLYLFLVNYDLLKGEGTTFQNNLFYHLRYNYKINDLLRWEAFSQMQNNNVAGIKMRLLLGTGPRFKISGTEKLALYASTAVMYENEKELTTPVIHHEDIRSSSYASFTWKPVAKSEIVSTLFFQPLFKNLEDYRVLHELNLRFNFTENFSFVTTWKYLFDSKPPAKIPGESYSIKNGIQYKF